MSDRLEELLQRELDGENAPDESKELRQRLADDPDARARHERLLGVARALDEVGQVEPPAGLLASVMRAVRGLAQPQPRREGFWQALAGAFARRPVFAYASAMAAGLVIGALLVGGLDDPAMVGGGSAASGAALPSSRLGAAALVDTQGFSVDGLRGEASIRQAQDVLLAELRLEGEGSVDVTLEFDEKALYATGIERSDGVSGSWTLSPGRLSLTGSGPGTYRLLLSARKPEPPPLRLRVRGEGASVEKTLATAAARR